MPRNIYLFSMFRNFRVCGCVLVSLNSIAEFVSHGDDSTVASVAPSTNIEEETTRVSPQINSTHTWARSELSPHQQQHFTRTRHETTSRGTFKYSLELAHFLWQLFISNISLSQSHFMLETHHTVSLRGRSPGRERGRAVPRLSVLV